MVGNGCHPNTRLRESKTVEHTMRRLVLTAVNGGLVLAAGGGLPKTVLHTMRRLDLALPALR